jgi:hypothetical protein
MSYDSPTYKRRSAGRIASTKRSTHRSTYTSVSGMSSIIHHRANAATQPDSSQIRQQSLGRQAQQPFENRESHPATPSIHALCPADAPVAGRRAHCNGYRGTTPFSSWKVPVGRRGRPWRAGRRRRRPARRHGTAARPRAASSLAAAGQVAAGEAAGSLPRKRSIRASASSSSDSAVA